MGSFKVSFRDSFKGLGFESGFLEGLFFGIPLKA